jgi:hypothetical protein
MCPGRVPTILRSMAEVSTSPSTAHLARQGPPQPSTLTMNQAEIRFDHTRLPDLSEHDDKLSIDTLTLGPDPTASTHQWQRWSLAIVTVLSTIAALAMIGAQDHREPGAVGSISTPLNILIVGDASAGGEGCAFCFSYVDQLSAAASEDGRRRVRIDDKTMSAQTPPPSMPTLVEGLRSNPELRSAVAKADVILLAMGNGDATHCPGTRRTPCPATLIPQFRQSLTDWMAETETIRHHRPVELRVITPPPTSGSPRQNNVARTACEIAASHDAQCVNVYDLARTDEHIVPPRTDPSHPRLTQHGHDRVATQLIAIGIT